MSSLANLNAGLQMVDSLIVLENTYTDPPGPNDRGTVYALRGASVVLLVSTFEEYLKIRTQEAVKALNASLHDYRVYDFSKLPQKLLTNHYHLTVRFALEGNRYDGLKPEDRIPAIKNASGDIAANRLDPVAFSQTNSNPNSKTLKAILNNLGIDDAFRVLKPYYETQSGNPVADIYIADNLDALIKLRNVVSHAISSMSVGRTDVLNYRAFIMHLSNAIDEHYKYYCDQLITNARIP
jgi:hypothetical protein